ncbi:hypothetical protein PC116_g26055 [Phytophthora cactorum]|uniref:Uncharacterized protein n=1 Tax=Phytophthora cactorum TaxID=29920 RepID=A0A8T1JR89_9STRA|nr:hypothetical protein PC111_g21441 [Phytophthora cactorum]KAG2797254.1 hypothetical protein PC112_g21855 [Phytophthora cactorum]KAG2825968.1 hypothetical protein PC113_g21848 [Phytophthora cactorum]KAG2876247.1 hypothetical protein PC114_g24294 [Phytophthora cactorum]KAG2883360.1 hypothetical protein PC115_g21637 [Phytophthora cactorum]
MTTVELMGHRNKSNGDIISMTAITKPKCAGVTLFERLLTGWRALQVSHQGSYSIERLESFDYYCRATSRTRVLLEWPSSTRLYQI